MALGDSLKRRRDGPPRPERPSPRRPRWPFDWPGQWRLPEIGWQRWLLLAVVIGLGSFGVGYLLSTQVFFPRPETAGEGVAVPDLTGQPREEAEATLMDLGLQLGDVREMKSIEVEAGRVMAQDPVAGQELLPGARVSLGVSAGPPELRVPPVAGLGEATARELLETVGFDVDVRQTRSADIAAGLVAGADPAAGTPQELPARVTLVVSAGPPVDAAAPGSGSGPSEATPTPGPAGGARP